MVLSAYGSFSSTASQPVTAGTPLALRYNTQDIATTPGVTCNIAGPDSRIYVTASGTYCVLTSVQIDQSSALHDVDFYLSKNGTALNSTSRRLAITANIEDILTVEWMLDLVAGDYVQVVVSSASAGFSALAILAAPPVPAIPSVITNIKQIAPGLSVYGSFSSSVTQSLTAGTALALTYNAQDITTTPGVTYATSKITVATSGIYSVITSIQADQTTALADFQFYVSINGTAVPNTATRLRITTTIEMAPTVEWLLQLAGGDYVEVYAYSASAGFRALAIVSAPPTPSVITNIKRIAPYTPPFTVGGAIPGVDYTITQGVGRVFYNFLATGKSMTITNTASLSVDYVAIGGGGAGGLNIGAGGGAGGLVQAIGSTLSAGTRTITIGAGGVSMSNSPWSPVNGANTSFGLVVALGGGGGSSGQVGGAGAAGGCGGGSTGAVPGGVGSQGFNGGAGSFSGGGGGVAGAGGNGNGGGPPPAASGGVGITYNNGTALQLGGGGGSGLSGSGAGGSASFGGGAGSDQFTTASNGTVNTGGGGGGGGIVGGTRAGNGGSGIFIISYPVLPEFYQVTPANWTDSWSPYLNALVNANSGATVTATAGTNMGATVPGSFAWAGGVLAQNGKIYSVPHNASSILEINPLAGTATNFGSFGGTDKWIGGVLAPNGKIYCAPATATTILVIDPTTTPPTATTFGTVVAGSNKWSGGVLAPNGKIYFVPRSETRVLILDPADSNPATAITYITGVGTGWIGGVLGPDGNIYCVPYGSGSVLKINTTTNITSTIGSGLTTFGWLGGALAPDGKIYCAPSDAQNVLVIYPAGNSGAGSVSTIGSGLGAAAGKWGGAVLAPNGKIYCMPFTSTSILVIDPVAATATTFGTYGAGSYSWWGGVLGPNGTIYGIPSTASTILQIQTGVPVSTALLNTPYFNKY